MMLKRLNEWHRRVHFPQTARAPLGFGSEYWDLDPKHYEGWEELRNRMTMLERTYTEQDLAYYLASHLLNDVIIAAGGVERAITKLREAHSVLKVYVQDQGIMVKDGLPLGFSHDGAIEAWYAFADVLSWSRTVIERLERKPHSKKFPDQGLIPAIRIQKLRKRCESLLSELKNGPVGQSRYLANFVLHSALVQNPLSGVQINTAGTIILPIPDSRLTHHWYLLTWEQERNGFIFAEELWQSIQDFIDELLGAFETEVPKRLHYTKLHE